MCQKCRETCVRPKLEHHIMPVLKFGRTYLMIKNQIFGRWDASFMKQLLSNHLSEPMTWKDFTKKLQEASIREYLRNIHKN